MSRNCVSDDQSKTTAKKDDLLCLHEEKEMQFATWISLYFAIKAEQSLCTFKRHVLDTVACKYWKTYCSSHSLHSRTKKTQYSFRTKWRERQNRDVFSNRALSYSMQSIRNSSIFLYYVKKFPTEF
jgi:hypothetical protein